MENINEKKSEMTCQWAFSNAHNFLDALQEVKNILKKFSCENADELFQKINVEFIGMEIHSDHQFSYGLMEDILGSGECLTVTGLLHECGI